MYMYVYIYMYICIDRKVDRKIHVNIYISVCIYIYVYMYICIDRRIDGWCWCVCMSHVTCDESWLSSSLYLLFYLVNVFIFLSAVLSTFLFISYSKLLFYVINTSNWTSFRRFFETVLCGPVCTYTSTHIYLCIYTCVYVYIYTYISIYIHIYIYICIQVYMYM